MDDLMRCLYNFVLEHRLGDTSQDREYQDGLDAILAQEEKVMAGMGKEQRHELNVLLNRTSDQSALENEKIFQAALRLARELNTLLRTV